MDAVFIEGMAATIASVIVFCGSVFFLLTMIMGARLAYLITASVTLGFILILGGIWSFSNEGAPLGPVGKLPEWDLVSVAAEGEPLEGPQAEAYVEGSGDWREVDSESDKENTQAAELGSAALDAIEAAIEEEQFPSSAVNNTADSESVRFLDDGGELYGAVTLNPPAPTGDEAPGEEAAPSVVALMQYDAGNPLWEARKVTLFTMILLIFHLVLLSLSEKKARRPREAPAS